MTSELLTTPFTADPAPSAKQPEYVKLLHGGQKIPVGGGVHKYYQCDKIIFDCPLHPPAYDESGLIALEDDTAKGGGRFTQGHRIILFAHAGPHYEFWLKFKTAEGTTHKEPIRIFGYTIEGTKITITPRIESPCTDMATRILSEELKQETGEIYYNVVPCGHTENYVSPESLTCLVREVRV